MKDPLNNRALETLAGLKATDRRCFRAGKAGNMEIVKINWREAGGTQEGCVKTISDDKAERYSGRSAGRRIIDFLMG